MNILFLHRNFPGQFKHLVKELVKDRNNQIVFITNNKDVEIEGIEKIIYDIKQQPLANGYLNSYSEAVLHGQAAAQKAEELKNKGFKPDIIYAHSWGLSMFMKDVFPCIPLICYFEWFYNAKGADFGFFTKENSIESIEQLRCKNSSLLVDLCSCNAGISPMKWQKQQFPKEFQDKINVIHDGIDTEVCKPDENAKFEVNNLELTADDEVITYTARGLEPYRGFPNFMKAVDVLLKKRSNAHFVIAGEDEVFYGLKIQGKTYKQIMLEQCDIDLSRVHFVGKLPFDKYLNFLQISSVHVYLTFPFVLSWSMLEAMSCGACIAASDTEPVKEVIKDNYNGLLFDFFNINQLIEKVEYALNNKEKIKSLKKNARKTIIDNYALRKLLPEHIKFINEKL